MRARRSSSVIGIAEAGRVEGAAVPDTSAADASETSNRPAWRPTAAAPASAADRTMKFLRCMGCDPGKMFARAQLLDPHLNARQGPGRSEGVPARVVSRSHQNLRHARSARDDHILGLLEERPRLYRQRLGKDTHSVAIAPEADPLEAREELYRSHAVTPTRSSTNAGTATIVSTSRAALSRRVWDCARAAARRARSAFQAESESVSWPNAGAEIAPRRTTPRPAISNHDFIRNPGKQHGRGEPALLP